MYPLSYLQTCFALDLSSWYLCSLGSQAVIGALKSTSVASNYSYSRIPISKPKSGFSIASSIYGLFAHESFFIWVSPVSHSFFHGLVSFSLWGFLSCTFLNRLYAYSTTRWFSYSSQSNQFWNSDFWNSDFWNGLYLPWRNTLPIFIHFALQDGWSEFVEYCAIGK